MSEKKDPQKLAKVSWVDPETGDIKRYVLVEGATATIGRSTNNDIYIPDKHVSRQHAVVQYRDGIFMISDLGSVNGTFVNNEKISESFPLFSGDEIRLYVPTLRFSAAGVDEADEAEKTGTLISATINTGRGKLIITNGPQEGHIVPLLLKNITIGRATTNATWEIGLQDPSVSRPHARMERHDGTWYVEDLESVNGTLINDEMLKPGDKHELKDGDIIGFGASLILYRMG